MSKIKSNVNKVKLLSERTFGVPPVIFVFVVVVFNVVDFIVAVFVAFVFIVIVFVVVPKSSWPERPEASTKKSKPTGPLDFKKHVD